MNKYKFELNILPLNNFLVGFNYQKGYMDNTLDHPFDELSIGIGFFSVSFYILPKK